MKTLAQAFAKLPPPEESSAWLPPVLIAAGVILFAAIILTAFIMGRAVGYADGYLSSMKDARRKESAHALRTRHPKK